jgi:hypothetical protein
MTDKKMQEPVQEWIRSTQSMLPAPVGYVKLIDTPFGVKLKPVLTTAVPVGSKLYTSPPAAQRQWTGLMQGVRVEREYVVVSVHGGNGAARKLCAALIQEMNT